MSTDTFKIGGTFLLSLSSDVIVSGFIWDILDYGEAERMGGKYYVRFDGDVYPNTYVGTEAYVDLEQLKLRTKSPDYEANVSAFPLKLLAFMPEWQAKWVGDRLVKAINSLEDFKPVL